MQKLHSELVKQANLVETAINRHNENLLSKLEYDVDVLYKKIQGIRQDEPTLIRLQLAEGNAANQQQVRLVVDYAKNRKSVAPSGYLSDSQIHTVALSLRLAAIRKFNTGAPIIVLDDVVTSYDADHRKTIASALAEGFEGIQIVLVTHDEQFFNLLQDHLPAATWVFVGSHTSMHPSGLFSATTELMKPFNANLMTENLSVKKYANHRKNGYLQSVEISVLKL